MLFENELVTLIRGMYWREIGLSVGPFLKAWHSSARAYWIKNKRYELRQDTYMFAFCKFLYRVAFSKLMAT